MNTLVAEIFHRDEITLACLIQIMFRIHMLLVGFLYREEGGG